jgi:hypothetical protein
MRCFVPGLCMRVCEYASIYAFLWGWSLLKFLFSDDGEMKVSLYAFPFLLAEFSSLRSRVFESCLYDRQSGRESLFNIAPSTFFLKQR